MNIVGFLVDVLKGALKDISGFFITFKRIYTTTRCMCQALQLGGET